ncbi:insulinase family protein [Gemmobacter lutimaris]|uniref:Insulinase family protein n=1 Tax=Gemmobacter lutimaris TaxID=2306023 RepID=A0A398BJE8_9RHOB|nr:pitrilysin family protein [Gemmobacter lutimaris]RID90789.1 insulinase family protein [Gemmobacter lutimaris]
MRNTVTAALLWSASATIALAEGPVTDFTLDNGLQVVVIEDHRAPVAVQMMWYKIGAADEPQGHSGIAHFFEHLMFKATDDLKPGEFSDIVEAQGGNDNAFTSWDQTAYFQRVAADRLDLMMTLEADRMRDLQLTDDVVATERSVILEERSQRTDSDPGSLFMEQLRAAQFLNHPYGVPIIGWRQEIEGLGRAEAEDFYRTYYAPNNAILIVAGDVTPDAVRAMAEKHYGPLAPTADLPVRQRPKEPPQLAERRLTMFDKRVSEPFMMRTYLAPNRRTGDQKTAAALVYLGELLGGSGTTSLLARKLQFEDPKAVYSYAYYDGTALDYGQFTIGMVPLPGVKPEEAEAELDGVLKDFLATGPDPAAFARLKTQLHASEIYATDDVDGLARRYGDALTTGLTVADVQAWPEVLQSVTPEDVMEAARQVLDRRHSVTGWLLTEEETQ